MRLYADNTGQPGKLLESYAVNVTNSTQPTICTSVLHPVLTSGMRYWLAVLPAEAASSGGWYWSWPIQSGGLLNSTDLGATWHVNPFGYHNLAAITIFGGTISPTNPTGTVEFFDQTTGADLGAATVTSSTASTTTWSYTTSPKQLQASQVSQVIQAVYTPPVGVAGSIGTLPGGLTVAPLPLTVSGITSQDKTYDGTTAAILNTANPAISGFLSGDSVSLDTSGAPPTSPRPMSAQISL